MGSITHAKVSGIADDPTAAAAGEVLPSHWNAAHVFSLVKADVGLGSVDNTADAAKSVASAAILTTARNIDGQSFNGSADITVIAPGTHAATSKVTPVDADEIPLVDSAALNVLKKLTWANLKATLKAYFDTLYPAGSGTSTGTNTGDQTITLTGGVTGSGTGTFAATLATPGTLTVATANSNATAHTHAITSSSAPGAAASILATDASGIIGSTGTRIVKGWFTDLTVTNAIAGSVTGSAATLTTARTINGTSFDGSANITVTAAAGTLTGATLNATVTASSLTSLGTLTSLTVSSGGVGAAAAFTASGSGSSGTITITDTGGNGVNLKLIGDGATTPNKTIRVHSGILQIVNSGYSAVISSLSDGGDFTALGAITAYSGTAIPAGGTASTGLKVSSTANFGIFFGSGAPTLTAAQGSLYLRSDGSSTSTRLYVNTTGSTTWTNVTTAA